MVSAESFELPAVYLSCGATDEWGCMAGSRLAVDALRARGARVEWVPRPGGHCDVEVASLAAFLVD